MTELLDRADKYAAGKANAIIDKAIAQAYVDGYRDGYKDKENEIPVDFRGIMTEFIDLGLPSGTLWSCDFEKEKENNAYIPYEDALRYKIPTIEQCNELLKNCKFINKAEGFCCVGPNGKHIVFSKTGCKLIESDGLSCATTSLFWIRDDNETNNNVARIMDCRSGVEGDSYKEFTGYKIPIRLVETIKQ